MPAVVPFIPLIGQGIGMAAGALGAKKAQKNAMQRSPEEMLALGGAQKIAGQAGDTAGSLITEGRQTQQQPASYFRTLLSGNRAAMANAVAAPTAALTETYRGAERGLERSGVRGAQRQLASGELARSRASQIGGLTTGVQPYAAEQLAKMGQGSLQAGTQLTGTAGNLYGNLLNSGYQNRVYGRQEGERAGSAIGSLVASAGNVFGNVLGKKFEQPDIGTGDFEAWKRTQTSYPY